MPTKFIEKGSAVRYQGVGVGLLLIGLALVACTAQNTPAAITPTLTPTLTSTIPPPAPTASPNPTVTPTPRPTHTPTLTPTPIPSAMLLAPMNYQWQTWNNCGPASVAIVLGYYDVWVTQHDTPFPYGCELRQYLEAYGLTSREYNTPPSVQATKALLAAGIPVIALQLLDYESDIGHFRVIKGYDDDAGEFICDDPLRSKGTDYRMTYGKFIKLSHPQGRIIAIYPQERDEEVRRMMRLFHIGENVWVCP